MRQFAVAAVTFALAAFGANEARGTTVQIKDGNLRIDAHSGEANRISVTTSGANFVVTDTGASKFNVTGGCVITGTNEASCPDSFTTILVRTWAEVDTVTIAESVSKPSDIGAGAADDTVIGGAGPDTINPGDGTDFVQGRGGNDNIHTRSSSPPAHPDRVDCGESPGDADVAAVDDADIVSNCEILNPGGPPPASSDRSTCYFTKIGTPGNNTIRGTRRGDNLYGIGGNDVLYGRGKHDCLYGGEGNDRLYGSGGRDRLFGDAGHDRLVGGRAADRFNGGRGRDVIRARDGNAEVVRCGGGRDTAYINRGDRTRGCERVIRG
jgi:Ca2+-binding RTX toxin-like protein